MAKVTKENIDQFFVDRFQDFESSLNGESKKPLHASRKSAIDAFKNLGMPHAKHEEYKYTNIAKQIGRWLDLSSVEEADAFISEEELNQFAVKDLDAYRIVFVNGVLNTELSDLEKISGQIEVCSLKDAQDNHPDDVSNYFSTHEIEGKDAFVDLNTSFVKEGIYIKVPKSAALEKPIVMYYINRAENDQVISQPRNLIIAEENSRLDFYELYGTIGEKATFTNAVNEVFLLQDAVVNNYKYQNESEQSINVSATLAQQLGKSVFSSYTFSFDGGLIRNNLNIALNSSHSEANMYGFYLLNNKTHLDNHTIVDHKIPDCQSNELYKGILDDTSRGVFNGKIFVREDAQRTDAFQSNRNVLLSDSAEIDTKPQLEIWADDVKCSHGCTVGQLDPEQLFYLRTRGLDKKTATAMLLNAFAADVLDTIPNESFKSFIQEQVTKKLS